MMAAAFLLQATRVGSPILGIIIPAMIFIISVVVTWMLYRHFSRH